MDKQDPFAKCIFKAPDSLGAKKEQFIEECRGYKLFRDWSKKVADQNMTVHEVEFRDIDKIGTRVEPLFMKWNAKVVVDGKPNNTAIFARGGSVAILVILRCGGVEYTVLTLQARVPIGKAMFPEIPAGMLDASDHFAGVAATELREETGIEIKSEELIDLCEMAYGSRWQGMYPSPGGCDEVIRLFMYQSDVSREKIENLKNRLTGVLEEGESITLKVVELDDLWREAPDAKALSALALYYNLKASGKIK